MNVRDVVFDPDTVLFDTNAELATKIFDRQSELEDHYWKIEKRPSKTIDINSRPGQIIIKDFLWRITEELGEALEAVDLKEDITKVHEEIADATHFLTGLFVVTDNKKLYIQCWDNSEIFNQPAHSSELRCVRYLIKGLGTIGNTLKLKPWKQTDVVTDIAEFEKNMAFTLRTFVQLLPLIDLTPRELYEYYYRKSEVNLFRIRSKY